jgi:DnaJ family protein C protein 2
MVLTAFMMRWCADRKALLLYHPDKTGRGDRDEVFIAIQSAYETLSDEKKKRAYDSELDFDEAIPTGRERGDFYKVRGRGGSRREGLGV